MPRPAFFFHALAISLVLVACKERKQALTSEIQVEVQRIAASRAKSPEDIQPYDEARAWHEYRVKRVLSGRLEADTIRVAHVTVHHGKAVKVSEVAGEFAVLTLRPIGKAEKLRDVAFSDDLEITGPEPPRFLDVTPAAISAHGADDLRCDYHGFMSQQMMLYWKLRGQLRLVVMGNSHATKGICAQMLGGAENLSTPVALNMAPGGASNKLQCLLLRDYVLPLPKIEWVVWEISPRSFNTERVDEIKSEAFLASPGRLHDEAHKADLWPMTVPPIPVTARELEQLGIRGCDIWGWEGRKIIRLPTDAREHRAEVLSHLKKAVFTWNDKAWTEFTDTVRALNSRGIRVMLLTTPMHPLVKEAPAADPDWTTHEGCAETVRHLQSLDDELALAWFMDFNKDGHHDFVAEEFYDTDHLNRAGATRFTQAIVQWLDRMGP